MTITITMSNPFHEEEIDTNLDLGYSDTEWNELKEVDRQYAIRHFVGLDYREN